MSYASTTDNALRRAHAELAAELDRARQVGGRLPLYYCYCYYY